MSPTKEERKREKKWKRLSYASSWDIFSLLFFLGGG